MTNEESNGATCVYVSNADSKDISVLRLDLGSGGLSVIQQIPVKDMVMPMAVSPNHRFLSAGMPGKPDCVASFAIEKSDGRLAHLGDAPLAGRMTYISTDRTGRYLFGATNPKSEDTIISVNPIDSDGRVRPPRQIVTTPP